MNNMGNMNAMGGIGGPGVPPGPQQPPQQGTDNRHAVYLNTYIYDYLLRNGEAHKHLASRRIRGADNE